MRRRTLVLTSAQRTELERVRDHDRRAYLREMAAGLLKVANGETAAWVAEHGLLRQHDPDTLYRWLTKYEQGGLPALLHRPRRRRSFSPRAGGGTAAPRASGTADLRLPPEPLAVG